MTTRACRRASRIQSGLTMVATITMTSAPPASRAVTAAVGDQPATISDLAKGPDMPNVNADPTANNRPSRKWLSPRVVVDMSHLPACNE